MAAILHTVLSEYLAANYRPDREFVDGEVRERNLGERSHSSAQSRFLEMLRAQGSVWNIEAFIELRVQVTPNRFRIPDVCVLPKSAPYEEIVTHPPLLCIEVLSKDDRMSDMLERVEDYLSMGVGSVWIVDPRTQRGYEHTSQGSREARDGVLCALSTPIRIRLADIFQD